MDSEVKFYAVKKGRKTGIFNTWEECKEQVHKFSGCKFKSFSSYEEAAAYLAEDNEASQQTVLPGQLELPTSAGKSETRNISKEKSKIKDIKLFVCGVPESNEEPANYLSVLEYNDTRKTLVKSFLEDVSPKEIVIKGIIDAISAVKMPCRIRIYTNTALDIKKEQNNNLVTQLDNLIQQKGLEVEFLQNTELVTGEIEKVKIVN